MKQNNNIKIISAEKLEPETQNGLNSVKNKSFYVINTKTNNVDIYYKVQDWRWEKKYNQFVKFSFPKNKELANWLVDKTDMKDVEEVIKKELNKLQNTVYVSHLALKYNDSKQPPFDEITIKNIKDIQLNKIKEDYFSEDFFDCSKEIKCYSEPIIQILYENNKPKKLYEPLLTTDFVKSGIYFPSYYNLRLLAMNILIEAKTANLDEAMEDIYTPIEAYTTLIKEKENLQTQNEKLTEEKKLLEQEKIDLVEQGLKQIEGEQTLRNEIKTLVEEANKLKEKNNNLKTQNEKLIKDLKNKDKDLKEIVKNNLIKGDYKLQKRNNDSLFSCCVPCYDNIDENDIENEVGGLLSKKDNNKDSKLDKDFN